VTGVTAGKKNYGQSKIAVAVVHPFSRRTPIRESYSRRSVGCLFIRIGRSIQGKVPLAEIVVGRSAGGTQNGRFRTQMKVRRLSPVEWKIERQLDVWHITMRAKLQSTPLALALSSIKPELLSY
jgi:hypothetical protein